MALAKGLNPDRVKCHLAVTEESEDQNLEVIKRFGSLGLKAHKIQMNGRFDLHAIAKLKTLIQNERIDGLHPHGYKSEILGLIDARLTKVKEVATPHGFENVKLNFMK